MCSRAAPFEPSESEIDFFSYVEHRSLAKTSSASTRRPPPHLAGCDGLAFGFRRRKGLKLRGRIRDSALRRDFPTADPFTLEGTGRPHGRPPPPPPCRSELRGTRASPGPVASQSRAHGGADHRRYPVGQPGDDRRRHPQPVRRAVRWSFAFFARKIARRPADQAMTFGYGRAEVVAALINYTHADRRSGSI